MAAAGRGRELPLDGEGTSAEAVWAHDIPASAFPTPIWPWLLLLAIVLVPVDVGIRRVALARSDFARAGAWIRRRVGLGGHVPEVVPGLSELRAAKSRSERRADRSVEQAATRVPPPTPVAAPPPAARPAPSPATSPRAPAEAATDATDPTPAADTLAARLRRRREGS
jgi:hypothetical protein